MRMRRLTSSSSLMLLVGLTFLQVMGGVWGSCSTSRIALRCVNIHLSPQYINNMHVPVHIEEVYLSNNQLGFVSADVLYPFRRAKKFVLTHNNRIREIPANAFLQFKNLTSLSLKGNAISELHPHALNGLSRLENLDLSDNHLTSLHHGMFQHVRGLRSLRLLNNRIDSIPNNVFTHMKHLRDLFLGRNNVQWLGDEAFQNMSMNKLDLTYNRIAKIPPTTFLNFNIKYKVMLYFNVLECSCKDLMVYSRYFKAMKSRMWGECYTPVELREKSILTAHTLTKCTLCDLHPCNNGGTCKGNQTDFTCICADEYKGKTCENSICKARYYYNEVVQHVPSGTVLKYSSDDNNNNNNNNIKDIRKQTHEAAKKNKALETKLLIMYAVCALELVIILCFVGLLIVGKYQDWRLLKKYRRDKLSHTLQRPPITHHANAVAMAPENNRDNNIGGDNNGCNGYNGYISSLNDRGKGYTSISQIIPAYKYDFVVR